MNKYLLLGVEMIWLLGGLQAAPLSQSVLERQTQIALRQVQSTGLRRFAYMRYYSPSEQFYTTKENSAGHVRALAMYLVNMYVSVRLYGNPNPVNLTLDYIGVLDGFEQQAMGFDFKHAVQFYKTHQKEVDRLLEQHLRVRSYPWAKPSVQERMQWVALLQTLPVRQQHALFAFPTAGRLQVSLVPSPGQTRLRALFTRAQTQIRKYAVVYEDPALQLEDFDSHIGNHTYRRKRTYRWVQEECHYSSYLLAKQLTHAFVADREAWKHTRLYLLTATPKHGEFLVPAQGPRFRLADGSFGLHWRYHTAVLVILQQEGAYVPVILDNFLGGKEPIDLGAWLAHFSVQTQFQARPFMRDKTTENALKIPSRTEGNAIWVNGNKFLPAAVVR